MKSFLEVKDSGCVKCQSTQLDMQYFPEEKDTKLVMTCFGLRYKIVYTGNTTPERIRWKCLFCGYNDFSKPADA